ncbi:MAG: cytochrome c6 PetJ [Phormidesmis priestleyi Ana]|uniref:Cytochrome c6 n=1 Tax=Phormidesmis priestleyi Ana TaxID=1666911 RepID=A0A0N8KNM9_9CYAN|nr:MAG: cytochrome c6 PetJ [Phormidesmis priestleyi Ana]
MKALFSTILAVVIGILLPLIPPAIAADLGQGAQVFSASCAACHVGGGNVVMSNKTLKQDALEQYLEGYGTEHATTAIVYQVTNGKGAMPSFQGRLTDAQIEDVAAYVQDQSEKGW